MTQQPTSNTTSDWQLWSKTVILLGMGVYMSILILTGNLGNYINLRFAWLAYVGAGIFFLLGLVNLYSMLYPQADTRDGYAPQNNYSITWGILAIAAFPLILAAVIPSRPLGIEAVNGGISLSPVGGEAASAFTRSPLDRNVLDWLRLFNDSETSAEFNGQPVDVIGFVYREPVFNDEEFMVARFTMSCCVADAFAIGLPVMFEDATQFTDGVWVRVQGTLKASDFEENFIPVVQSTSVEIVSEPEQPYLYP
jgi:uncharacterized repeat protein (TIGR03943 family)